LAAPYPVRYPFAQELAQRWICWNRDPGGDAASGSFPGSPHQVPILARQPAQVKVLRMCFT
jgi:hypothetical protein